MAFSQASLVTRVRNVLADTPYLDTCTEVMDTTETGLDVGDTTQYTVGQIVEFQDDGELCLVTALPGSTTLTVVRNYLNSVTATPGTGTTHVISTLIARNPTYRFSAITQALQEAIDGLWPYVYKTKAVTLTPVQGTKWYDLTDSEIIELQAVVQASTSSPSAPFLYGVMRGSYPVDLYFNMPTAIVASGSGIYIPYLRNVTNSVFVTGIGRVTSTVSGGNYSDLTSGFQTDCVQYYAVSRLVLSLDTARMTESDISMGDESVRPLARTQLSQVWDLKGLQERRKWEQDLKIRTPRRRMTSR